MHDRSESKIALEVSQFVKRVLPYGANNRGEDPYRNKKISPKLVDPQFAKMYTELNKIMGKYTPVQNLHHILIQAEIAIKYGAGNCEQQAAIAFVALLAKNIFEVSRVAVSKKEQGHVFIEFIDPNLNELIALDTWDNNTIYSITKRTDSHKSAHTGIRTWGREIISSRGAGFAFNQFNELLNIKFINSLNKEQLESKSFSGEYLACINNKGESFFSSDNVSQYFKTFLFQSIKNSRVITYSEKLECIQKLGATIPEWEAYLSEQSLISSRVGKFSQSKISHSTSERISDNDSSSKSAFNCVML